MGTSSTMLNGAATREAGADPTLANTSSQLDRTLLIKDTAGKNGADTQTIVPVND